MTPTVEGIWAKIDQKKGIRALQHSELLPMGTIVKPAFSVPGVQSQTLTCQNSCWLFFVDKAPGAHFAHPVSIVLLDAETGEQKIMETEWWPQIDIPDTGVRQIFNTREQRTDPHNIIFERLPVIDIDGGLKPLLPEVDFATNSCGSCISWAVVVCGYDDLPDTFDEDTDGIYSVLKNLGLSDDHIFFVSPHTSHAGVDRELSKTNVEWAIEQVANQANENDKVLFFYSSHGNIDYLTCGSQGISAAELESWFSEINYKEMTIIVEACHSGSLIGKYADGTYIEAEDNLKGANRVVFTSASTDTSSYPDKDGADDPNQTTDIGSETIYGYVEAFSIASADTNFNGAISFSEALQYALDNDVTLIRGLNQPQWAVYPEADPDMVYPHCYPISEPNGPYSGLCTNNTASMLLDGSGSEGPDPCGTLSYFWYSDCAYASFSDPTSPTPTLLLSSATSCLDFNVSLTTTCSDGSSDTCSTTVTINDTMPPVITCPADATINCDQSANPSLTGQAVTSDNCSLSPTLIYMDTTLPGPCPQTNTIQRTWEATDARSNYSSCVQVINSVDNVPPTLVGVPGNQTVECDAVPTPANVTATDNCDTSVTPSFDETRVDGTCEDNYTLNRTWTAADDCGNSSSAAQTITVKDTVGPVISCNAPATIFPSDVPISLSASATDNCDDAPVVEIMGYDCYMIARNGKRTDKKESCMVAFSGNTVTINDSGGIGDHITWMARSTDDCGNESEIECEVEVVIPTKP